MMSKQEFATFASSRTDGIAIEKRWRRDARRLPFCSPVSIFFPPGAAGAHLAGARITAQLARQTTPRWRGRTRPKEDSPHARWPRVAPLSPSHLWMHRLRSPRDGGNNPTGSPSNRHCRTPRPYVRCGAGSHRNGRERERARACGCACEKKKTYHRTPDPMDRSVACSFCVLAW